MLLVAVHERDGPVGVASAYLQRNQQLRMQLWHYRAFVASAHRMSNLATLLAMTGRDRLAERYLAGADDRDAGLVYEVENPGLKHYFNKARSGSRRCLAGSGPMRDTARAMSQENVEIVMRAIDAFSRGDADAFADLTTPDLEWTTGLGPVEGEIFRGREGVETYFGRLGEAWDEFRLLPDELREFGDVVLVLGRLEGRGRGSGVLIDSTLGAVWDLRGGKIWRLRAYLNHAEALEAAGLSE